ncbi:MAG: M15 family metallopeptidase [Actinomycetota bacterium]
MIRFRQTGRIAAAALLTALAATSSPALAVGGEGESWPSFNESDGCGSPWSIGPNAETKGSLDSDTVLRGPQAAYFGRTVDQVQQSLVPWDVPMSDGEVLNVHARTLPALQQVATGLADASARDWSYDVFSRQTYAYVPRTVGGLFRVSQHTFGNAVDINSSMNPSTMHSLETDMPSWFVRAWTDAGFCWGGAWIDKKDAMHYSWRGPAFTPGLRSLPAALPPLTGPGNFSREIYRQVVPSSPSGTRFEVLMDADGDSVIDVVSVSGNGGTMTVSVASARSGYAACDVQRYRSQSAVPGVAAIPGDWDRDGIQDLWIIDDASGVTITALLNAEDFAGAETVRLDAEGGDAYLSADHNVDGWSDLYILRRTGSAWTIEVRDGADRFLTVLTAGSFEADPSGHFTAIDRNLDQIPDLVAATTSGMSVFDGASGFSTVGRFAHRVGTATDIAGTDFDGDGRHDLAVLSDGTLTVHAGNSILDGAEPTSWFLSPDYACDRELFRVSGR